MTKARLHAVALIAPKSWILKFETKKDAEISPRSSVPRLENFQSKTQTRNKEINEAFSSRDSCSIALLDQYFNHSHKLVTVDLLGRHYVAITQQEKSSIQDSIGPPSKRMAHVLWSTLRDICQVKEKLRKRDEMPPKIHTKLAEIFELGALILWGRFRLQEETSTYSWLLTICQNGSKQKRSPPMMPELGGEKTKRIHDAKIKNRVFNVGDRVLLFNSRLKIFSGKLKSRWSGPFTVVQVFPYGTVELSQNSGPNFKVNGHRIILLLWREYPPRLSRISKRSPWTNKFGGRVKRRDPKQALRGRHPMLIRSMYSRIVKALDSVIFNSSFTSSASFWEFTLREDSAILSMGDLERITRKDEKKYKPKQTKPDSEWKAVKDKAQAKAKDQEKSKSKSNQQINSQNGAGN
ncbi:hypothetical protein Tco_1493304 [Tanacetum coccineum]|uniref:Reverse transcriptase domain-containing protein n=1 Tax=Tanacetum coccineum TaxID=301880 RepID=A0ABQ5H4B2_9ASTR